MSHKITKADAAYFKSQCEKYIDLFGLYDFLWMFETDDDLFRKEGQNATCGINDMAKYRVVSISSEIEKFCPDKKKNLDYLAFHEVMEGLLGDAHVMALDRFTTEKQIDGEFHAIIQRLWNFFQRYEIKRRTK